MTLKEMKKKVLVLIEECNPFSEYLTDDEDIAAKINDVINQILYEIARFKKIPKTVDIPVIEGQQLEFSDIEAAIGYEIYQIDVVYGVRYVPRANGTVLKMLDSGTAEIDCFVYPAKITEDTPGTYEFELSSDALEVMPYGIAGDLLKTDVSTNYGQIYSARYQEMLQRMDSRYQMPMFTVEGGFDL